MKIAFTSLKTCYYSSRRSTVSGRLIVNLCTALSLLYFSGVSNSAVIPHSHVHVYCKVTAILGHWILLALFHALAVQALWLYLKLGRPLAQEPCYYSVKAILTTWGKLFCASSATMINDLKYIFCNYSFPTSNNCGLRCIWISHL